MCPFTLTCCRTQSRRSRQPRLVMSGPMAPWQHVPYRAPGAPSVQRCLAPQAPPRGVSLPTPWVGLAWRRVAVLRAVRPIYSAPVTRREGQRIGWLGVAVALLVIAIPVAEFAYFAIVGDEACSRGDSDFGVSSWSWIPSGHVCRYDGLEGTVETVGPSPFMSLYLVAALVFVWLLVVRRRRASSSLIHE